MVANVGEDTSIATSTLLRHWGILFGVLALLFGATVFALNSTLYSASGFVSSYLDSLGRHDIDAALAMPGMQAPADADGTLLNPDAISPPTSYTLINDDDAGDGRHRLTFKVDFAGGSSAVVPFFVEHTGPRMGVFSGWRFVQSPLGVLQVTPLHATEFELNGVTLTAADGAGVAHRYQVLRPSLFTLSHDSKYLSAEPVSVIADTAVQVTEATVDIQASDEFVTQVESELAEYLDECATQKVLQPTNCPFGQTMTNRIEGLPQWSIALYPDVAIQPGGTPETWVVPPTPAAAHLSVEVRSLFDGSLSTFDEDVPFTIEYLVTFPGDGSLHIEPR